jgi:hypothetical protein
LSLGEQKPQAQQGGRGSHLGIPRENGLRTSIHGSDICCAHLTNVSTIAK